MSRLRAQKLPKQDLSWATVMEAFVDNINATVIMGCEQVTLAALAPACVSSAAEATAGAEVAAGAGS